MKKQLHNNFNVGKVERTLLDNGLLVISEFVPNIASFATGVCINVGSRDDYEDKKGIAHFMEHSAFRRTKHRTSKQIANAFEILGAYSNAFTTKDITCYYVRAITEHFTKTFEIISDIALNTKFVNNEIEKEKLIILEEIKSYEDDPEENICDLIDTLVFADTNLAHPIIGTQESVSNITISDLEKFQYDFYYPSNMIISVAGNIEHNQIIKLANKYFNSDNHIKKNFLPIDNNRNFWRKKIKDFSCQKSIQQVHIMLGTISEGYRSSDRFILPIANSIFGDGMSSRLYQVLREKNGLAYSIYSSVQNYVDCGTINIYAATEEKKNKKTIDLIFQEMEKLNNKVLPTKTELLRAKEQLKTATIIELESMSSRMQNLLKQEIGVGRIETIFEIISKIEEVTLDEIIEINKKYFNPNMWCKCCLTP